VVEDRHGQVGLGVAERLVVDDALEEGTARQICKERDARGIGILTGLFNSAEK